MDTENNVVSVTNLVVKFGDEQAPLLRNKPKVFLFQFCRSDILQLAWLRFYSFFFLFLM